MGDAASDADAPILPIAGDQAVALGESGLDDISITVAPGPEVQEPEIQLPAGPGIKQKTLLFLFDPNFRKAEDPKFQ